FGLAWSLTTRRTLSSLQPGAHVMSEDQRDRNALIQRVKTHLRNVGLTLDGKVKWQIKKIHGQPEGLHFTCDNPRVLQQMADDSSHMALDLSYPTPQGFDDWGQTSVGYTEKGAGPRLHIDLGLEDIKLRRS